MKLCPIQEICNHFSNGTKRRSHHIRLSDPCKKWLVMDCERILELGAVIEYATGKPMACNIEKVKRIKEQK